MIGDTPFPGGLPEGFGEGSIVDVVPTTSISNIVDNIKDGTKGIYGLLSWAFDFIVNNPLCMLMVSLSFAGAGLGLVGRAFKTARR